jgi:two-component sensor histidine kinase
VPVDDQSATPLALLIHELATNATKYGALGEDGGMVHIRSELQGGDLALEWLEDGGPSITGEPQRTGFGTVLSQLSIRDQLGGELTREWNEAGLRVTIRVPQANLQRQVR